MSGNIGVLHHFVGLRGMSDSQCASRLSLNVFTGYPSLCHLHDGTVLGRCVGRLAWERCQSPQCDRSHQVGCLFLTFYHISHKFSPPRAIFSSMFSSTIMLLVGGFTIASAITKTGIDRLIITRLLSWAGKKPSIVLLSFMGVSCFASMWIRYAYATE